MAHGIIHAIRHAIIHGAKHGGSSVLSSPASLFGLLIGDSNAVGQGVGDSADTALVIGTPNTGVMFNAHYANGTGPPPTFIDFPGDQVVGSLGLYAASGISSYGTEITTGALLKTVTSAPFIAKIAVSGSTLATEWLPTATYPFGAVPTNLFNQMVARVHQLEAKVARTLDFVMVHLGTNDALSNPNSAAFQANMGALATAMRAIWPGLKIVWVKTNGSTSPGDHPGVAALRAGQVAYVAGDAATSLIDNDDLALLPDLLHYKSDAYVTLGQRMASSAISLLGISRPAVVGAPVVAGAGSIIVGTGNLAVASYGDSLAGDIEYLAVTTGIVAGTIPTPSGWTAVAATSSLASGVTEQYSVFSRVIDAAMLTANSGHTAPTTVAPTTTTRHAAKTFTVRGPTANPTTDASQVTSPNTFDTGPTTFSAVTSTASNAGFLLFTGGYCGANPTMSATNGTLTGFTRIQPAPAVGVIVTDREVIDLFYGTRAAAGSSGTFSVSCSLNMVKLGVAVAVKP